MSSGSSASFLQKRASGAKRSRSYRMSRLPSWLYESPHRILATLGDIAEMLAVIGRLLLAREITKIHEEFVRGSAQERSGRAGEKAIC